MPSSLLGIDVGGTFTDFVLIDVDSRTMRVWKVLTTPKNPTLAITKGAAAEPITETGGLGSLARVVHGTTLVTNTIIERKGARVGLITTAGHRDALEIGNEIRYDLHDLFMERPKPIVPRSLRGEVRERVSIDGEVLLPIDEDSLERTLDDLLSRGVEIVAVCLLNSFVNPDHEHRVVALIEKRAPGLSVVSSYKVGPEIREYERLSTTTLNAYVRPAVERYLTELRDRMGEQGLQGEIYVMLSSGGFTTMETAAQYPIRLIESGPAAGALAAGYYSSLPGSDPDVIAFDMGGTTAKICLVEAGRPRVSTVFETDRVDRFKRGSGLPVKVPVIDMIEIGAGGGSIARVDGMGLLKVGPASAGADPGPACYGLGGTEPTVTDANVLLGYLSPSYFLGGSMRLDRQAAERAFSDRLCGALGKSGIEAAIGVFELVCENMAGAAKVHLAERGSDPRRFTLVAFGGAGPVHAYRVAQLLRVRRVVYPVGAGTFSAFGMLVAPMSFDLVRTYVARLGQIDFSRVRAMIDEMEVEGRELLRRGNILEDQVMVRIVADMRFVGQGHEVSVPLTREDVAGPDGGQQLAGPFQAEYERQFGRILRETPVEVINWRVVVSGPGPDFQIADLARDRGSRGAIGGASLGAVKGDREVYFHDARRFLSTAVYARDVLRPGAMVPGPAVIEETNSTIVIGPRATGSVDGNFSVVVDLQ